MILKLCAGTSAFLVRGSMPPCRLRRNFWKFDYEVVHSEVYLNKYVVSIAPFSTRPACPGCSQNRPLSITYKLKHRKLLFFVFFNFSSIFPEGSADPICPYVRTPMALWSRLSVLLKTTQQSSSAAHSAADFADLFRWAYKIRTETANAPSPVITDRVCDRLSAFDAGDSSNYIDPARTWLVKRVVRRY